MMEKGPSFSFKGFSSVPSFHLRHVRSSVHLFPFEEAPRHLQGNPSITAGYRCYLSARQCLKSMFILSNELVNIWTHFAMVFVWICLLLYDQMVSLPKAKANIEDHFVHLTYVLCVQICMVASTGYHTFNSHTLESVCVRWYAVDIAGIITGILGCYIPGLHYGFYCFSIWKWIYLLFVGVMIIFSIVFITHPLYLSKSWSRPRLTHLTCLVLFGIIPATHWVFLSNGKEVKMFLPDIITLYLIMATAFSFYLSRVPERCLPGKFNLIGQSHNIWHIFTAMSFVYWRGAALRLMAFRLQNGCQV